ncbi:MAG TPA: CPBP family glutamic-type intramembrane protease, partial [Longimicrobiaceae bacterium]|nr:CPBP family glutamic-type intramembrane protease [Longimicrobiaceae bacterium]
SVVYALLFGVIVGTVTQWLLGGIVPLALQGASMDRLPLGQSIVLSLGAGIYEELVFRVILVGFLLAVFKSAGLSRGQAGVFAALLAALLFSAFHYVGPYAYPLELGSFTFRFLAGLAFSALYLVRGFGIAAWTHALYDVFLVVARGG